MNAPELLADLEQRGVALEATPAGGLRYHPKEAVTPELLVELKENKATLIALLEPKRTPNPPECPARWQHIPELPAKHELVTTTEDGKGTRWRCCLFERWYIIRFCPNTSAEQVEATSQDGKRYSLPSMDSLYRALWAEAYAPHLTFRETN